MKPAHENEYSKTLVDGAIMLGYMAMHQRPARRGKDSNLWETAIVGNAGWPDVFIAGHGLVMAIELKQRGKKPTPAQERWLTALRAAGVDARLAYVDQVDDILKELASRAAHPSKKEPR